jgi:hypothetical protein
MKKPLPSGSGFFHAFLLKIGGIPAFWNPTDFVLTNWIGSKEKNEKMYTFCALRKKVNIL